MIHYSGFLFEEGVGLGNKLSLRATQTGTQFWVVEYFSPNGYSAVVAPLTAINPKEYWNVSGVPATSQSFIDLYWDGYERFNTLDDSKRSIGYAGC